MASKVAWAIFQYLVDTLPFVDLGGTTVMRKRWLVNHAHIEIDLIGAPEFDHGNIVVTYDPWFFSKNHRQKEFTKVSGEHFVLVAK